MSVQGPGPPPVSPSAPRPPEGANAVQTAPRSRLSRIATGAKNRVAGFKNAVMTRGRALFSRRREAAVNHDAAAPLNPEDLFRKTTIRSRRSAGGGSAETSSAPDVPPDDPASAHAARQQRKQRRRALRRGNRLVEQALARPREADTRAASLYSRKPLADMRAELSGLLYQQVGNHSGEQAVGRVMQGEPVAAAAPGFPWRQDFEFVQDLLDYTQTLEQDAGRIEDLAEKIETGDASPGDAQTLSDLLHAHKENLALIQGRIGAFPQESAARAKAGRHNLPAPLIAQTKALSQRLAGHHMEIADTLSRYGAALPETHNLSAPDRLAHDLRATEGFLNALYILRLEVQEPSRERGSAQALERTISAVQAHRTELSRLLAARASPAQARLRDALARPAPPGNRLPAPAAQAAKQRLLDRWGQSRGAGAGPALPVSDPDLSQHEMLEAFLEHQLDFFNTKLPLSHAQTAFLFGQTRVHARNLAAWPLITDNFSLPAPEGGKDYRSEIEPAGVALAPRFEERYGVAARAAKGICAADRFEHRHVANLAVSRLRNSEGALLYEGLRHAALDPSAITGEALRKMSIQQLTPLLDRHYWNEGMKLPGQLNPRQLAAALLLRSAGQPEELDAVAAQIRRGAIDAQAQELAAAALISDPAKLERALAGDTVKLPMNVVSLLTAGRRGPPDQRAVLNEEAAALQRLANDGRPVVLRLTDENNRPRPVSVEVDLNLLNFDLEETPRRARSGEFAVLLLSRLTGWRMRSRANDPGVERLIGPLQASGVGGKAGAALAALDGEIRALNDRRDTLLLSDPEQQSRQNRDSLFELDRRIEGLDKNRRSLELCAEQSRTLWRGGALDRGGEGAYAMAARLSALCHLIGEKPIVSDHNGLDRTGQLDGQVKYLLARADRDGVLPGPSGQPELEEQTARAEAVLHSGNRQLERLNAGLPPDPNFAPR